MTLVRPMLEYASSSWNPYTYTDIKRLEQFRIMRFALYATTITLEQLLLALLSPQAGILSNTGVCSINQCFYKFHNNLVNCQTPSPVKSTDKIRSTRSHQLTYCQLQANVSVFNYSFFPRVIKVWNLLPYGVTSSSILSSFKQSTLPAIRSET